MEQQGSALNESLQLHELLTFKNLCLTKSFTMSPLVSDEELKSILKQDVTTGRQHVTDLRRLIEQSNITTQRT